MYKATAYKSLAELKRSDWHPGMIWGIIGALVVPIFNLSAVMYFFILSFFAIIILSMMGRLPLKVKRQKITISQDKLSLEWMDNELVEVNLHDVSPKYTAKKYRLFWIFPQQDYIHLLLDGGPLGPHEFFFKHDGDYSANQWEKLSLRKLDASQVIACV